VLERGAVRTFYDRFGARQDAQAFYEEPALDDLVAHGAFDEARHVYELGCGTGRFAATLLARALPAEATYLGVDLSSTMVGLASARLAAFRPRAEVRLVEGEPRVDAPAASLDRVVSSYVLDLLPHDQIRHFLADAGRALMPGGRLCLVSLTHGQGPASRALIALWKGVFRIAPSLLGGCRPIEILDDLPEVGWRVLHRGVVVAWGVPSEVVVARREA
jgi:ubiquinone/menaquinone biosynthesis C-methylase UbiE